MRGLVGYLGVLFCAVIGAVTVSVCATESVEASPQEWGQTPVIIKKLGKGVELSDTTAPCDGSEATISVIGYDDKMTACVFGSTGAIRVARYSLQGLFLYAVAFPSDVFYSKIEGLCVDMYGCSYAPNTDAFVAQYSLTSQLLGTTLYQHFSRSLVFHPHPVAGFYTFEPNRPGYSVRDDGGELPVTSSAFSRDGKWLVVEARGFALLRINVATLEIRYIVPPDPRYDPGNNPQYELAISNDGSLIGVGGFGLGLDVIEITDGCSAHFVSRDASAYRNIPGCRYVPIDYLAIFPEFTAARRLRFSQDGLSLQAMIFDTHGITQVQVSAKQKAPGQFIDYVGLGDSFSSGEGELSDAYYIDGTNTKSNRCHVSSRSYPYLLGKSWGVATRNIACSGARIADVLSPSDARSQLQQLKEVRPKVVSVGLGGNDAGLMDKLKSCLWIDTCEWAEDTKLRASVWREIYSIGEKLQQLVNTIRLEMPDTAIILMSYPRLIAGYEVARCDALTGALLNGLERRFIDEAVQYLNLVVRSVSGVAFGDVEGAFIGEELCNGQSLAMNGVRLGDDIAPISQLPMMRVIGAESFHPTPYGHAQVAQRLLTLFPAPSSVGGCRYCGTLSEVPPQYWQGGDGTPNQPQLIAESFTDADFYAKGEVATISLNRYFSPSTKVTVELHSNRHILPSSTADEDGSVHFGVTIPSDTSVGYHTLHVLGVTRGGKELDIYQTVWVGEEDSILPNEPSSQPTITTGSETRLTPQSEVITLGREPVNDGAVTRLISRSDLILGQHEYAPRFSVGGSIRSATGVTLVVVIIGGILGCILLVSTFVLVYRKRRRKV